MKFTDILMVIVAIIIISYSIIDGLSDYWRNQDTMLCESAKKSGNEEYLKKCQCYYQGGRY